MSISKYYGKYTIRPTEDIYDLSYASANANAVSAQWPSMNIQLDRKSVQRRPGYILDRTLETGDPVYDTMIFTVSGGTSYSLILTEKNLIKRESASGKTWRYLTDTYATGTCVASGTGVEGTTTDFVTAGIAAGDKFVSDTDHTADEELDTSWRTVSSVTDADTLVLSSAYVGTGTGSYKLRRVYSVPSGERWSWAVVADKFCFSNGNVPVQYWAGSGYAADLDATNALKARYLLPYGDRLFLADYYTGATRYPFSIKWSKNGDPTDWVDATAGEIDFLNTQEYITGMGQVGVNILIYKSNSIIIGNRTGDSTDPFEFPTEKTGVGLVAPYSLVNCLGTNVFIGKDNFYYMNGDTPEVLGDSKIRDKFFSIVTGENLTQTWGKWLPNQHKICWIANTNTSDGKMIFAYDTSNKTWATWKCYHSITSIGVGG